MSKTHPNLAIRSLADLQRRKQQLQRESVAAREAALGSVKPLQTKFSGLFVEKVAPVVALATGLGIAYQFLGRKKTQAAKAVPQQSQTTSAWVALSKFTLPLLKMALPLLQNWYTNYQNRPTKPRQ